MNKNFLKIFLKKLDKALRVISIFGIYLYKFLSKFFYRLFGLPSENCRFYPTCSEYAKEAFLKQSFSEALILTMKRILKCQPWNEGGFDPLS